LVSRASFNHARTNFALCTLLGHLIYMVGGMECVQGMHYKPETVKTSSGEESSDSDTDYSYTKFQMSKCTEKYYIEDDEWDVMPC
jgi:hypothetical protein